MEYIRKFLAANYSDEQLAALLAHAESGRLSYYSCCCLVGIPTAKHALLGAGEYNCKGDDGLMHIVGSRCLPYAREAEEEFAGIGLTDEGGSDALRRERLIPIIREEIARRDLAYGARIAHEGDLVKA